MIRSFSISEIGMYFLISKLVLRLSCNFDRCDAVTPCADQLIIFVIVVVTAASAIAHCDQQRKRSDVSLPPVRSVTVFRAMQDINILLPGMVVDKPISHILRTAVYRCEVLQRITVKASNDMQLICPLTQSTEVCYIDFT